MSFSTLTYQYLEIPETKYLEEEIITRNIPASYIALHIINRLALQLITATISFIFITIYTTYIEYIRGLCDICDVTAQAFLASKPKILTDSLKLLSTVHSYLGGLGLRRLEDYALELSMWADVEIEGWYKPQIVVKLFENGVRRISEKGLDEFKLLENILRTASELIPRETLTEILISVE
jgi:hypothetical protein